MGEQTIVTTGAEFDGGLSGFIILTDQVDLAMGDKASGEELQDHDCALAIPQQMGDLKTVPARLGRREDNDGALHGIICNESNTRPLNKDRTPVAGYFLRRDEH